MPITVADYLLTRIHQLGINEIFGVPGDFNLFFLDYVSAFQKNGKRFNWIGCCNELNAAYAADGYGRIAKTPGVLITTYGVGELSALNGISGSKAEQVPVLHIVGTTGRPVAEKQLMIHHVSPGFGHELPDHRVYEQLSKPFSVAHEYLCDPAKVAHQIDYVITQVYKNSLPGYLFIPVDMVAKNIDEKSLDVDLPLSITNPDEKVEAELVDGILRSIYDSKNPIILADTLAERHRTTSLVREFADKTKFLSCTTGMGRGIIDEDGACFLGVYNGRGSAPGIADAVEASDLVIDIGPLITDSNTGGFARFIKDENLISLNYNKCSVKGKVYMDVHFLPVLKLVLAKLDISKIPACQPEPMVNGNAKKEMNDKTIITQPSLVSAISSIMGPGDSLIIESGTFQFACHDVKLKQNSTFISQIFYSSIGMALPCALGAAVARRELGIPGKLVLVEGDGSAQMTIQELGTIVRQGLAPIVFLLNNDGYSIERAIWGPEQDYNDICPNWKWTRLCEAFGGVEGETCKSYTVNTSQDLTALLESKEFVENTGKLLMFVEVILDKFEYPWRLEYQVERMLGSNARMYKEYAQNSGEL